MVVQDHSKLHLLVGRVQLLTYPLHVSIV